MNANLSSRLFPPARRTLATGLLALMAAIWLLTFAFDPASLWTRLVQAAAEASLVGGIADWFAVTALFRRPLGLPIPHTAIVPTNKDRIGEGLATFLGEHFLSAESLTLAIRRAEPARRLGVWLSDERRAREAARRLFKVAPMRDADVLAARVLQPVLRRADMRPLLDIAADALSATELDAALLDDVLQAAASFLRRKERHLNDLAARRRQGLLRRSLDRQVMRAILEGLERLLHDLSDRDSPSRKALLDTAQARIRMALLSRDNGARLHAWLTQAMESPQFESWLASVLAAGAGEEGGREAVATDALAKLGQRLRSDAQARGALDDMLAAFGSELLPIRTALVDLIRKVVEDYETRTFSNLIERAVDNDLQFIRINGTVIGAVVGCLLFLMRTAVA